MRRALHILLVGVALLTLATALSAVQPKGKLFIIGGGSRSDALMQRMVDEADLGGNGYILVIPLASAEPDSAFWYAARQLRRLSDRPVKPLYLGQGREVSEDSIRNAGLIYLTGGDQRKLMNAIRPTARESLFWAYEEGAVIGGTSAGAAVMAESMITGDQKEVPEYEPTFSSIRAHNLIVQPGLGLVGNVFIDQHFVTRSRYNRLLTALASDPEVQMGVGIEESTAILVVGKRAEVVGERQVVVMRRKGKVRENGNWVGLDKVEMKVLLPGDEFKLKQ